jgi:hypothetical protein
MEKVREENVLLASQDVGLSDEEQQKLQKKRRRKEYDEGIVDDGEVEEAEDVPRRRKRKEKDATEKKEPKVRIGAAERAKEMYYLQQFTNSEKF